MDYILSPCLDQIRLNNEINYLILSQTFYKITNREENHHGFQYVNGLNILQEPFAETGSCVAGGFYFADIHNILAFVNYGIYLREVTLPLDDLDFKIYKDGNKWRANKIILGKRYNLSDIRTFEYLILLGANITENKDCLMRMASKNGYLEICKYSVESGANVNSNNNYAIGVASANGHLEIIKYLVSLGADISIDDYYVLRIASANGHLEIIKYLVSLGADIHCAIRIASEYGHLEIIKYLVVSLGIDVRANYDYAIITAIRNKHTEVARYLYSIAIEHNGYAKRSATQKLLNS